MLAAAGSPWVYPSVFVLVVLDAFLVVVPSETVVVALGALAFSHGAPNVWLLLAIAAVGAVVGDNLCYLVGRRIGTDRFRWMSRPRVAAMIGHARRAIETRPATLILTARYIPYARIAANLTAGAIGFRYGRYLPLTLLAGSCWAVYNVVIGAVFGSWLGDNPVLAVLVSVVVAVCLGVLVDLATARAAARRRAPAAVNDDSPGLHRDPEV